MDLIIFIALIVVVLGILAGIAAYITRSSADHGKKSLKLYLDWAERFELPALSAKRGDAKANSKILASVLKIVWDKKDLEELYLRHDIPNLKQSDALDFVLEADELFLSSGKGKRKKTDAGRGFIYDVHEAREGSLHLIAVDKDSHLYRDFAYGQALIKAIRDITPLNEFPEIALEEETVDEGLATMQSFVIAKSNMSLDPRVIDAITSSFSQRFGDQWVAVLLSEDVIKFQRTLPEEAVEAPRVVKEASPFAQRQEQKRLQAAEAQAALEAAEEARKAKWAEAERQRREAELDRRRQAIARGELSPLAEKPHAFIAQVLEIAVDASMLFTIEDEFEIKKVDNIGTPTVFTVYTSELIETTSSEFITFIRNMVTSLGNGFGGSWNYSTDSVPASSITFVRSIA